MYSSIRLRSNVDFLLQEKAFIFELVQSVDNVAALQRYQEPNNTVNLTEARV